MKHFCFLKVIIALIISFINLGTVYGQNFPASGSFPLNLAGANQDITGCSSNRSITFTVSGVGVLSATNQLLEIDLRLRTNRRLYGDIYLQAPNGGPCIHIADRFGDGSNYNAQNIVLDYKFRSPNSCLSKYPDYAPTSGQVYVGDADSRSGVFATVGNITTALNGVNANGTWTMYFGRGSSNEPPSVLSAELSFGTPLPVSPPDPSAGINCVNAVVWDGGPLCATTAGKTSTAERPLANISGCNWMSTSENNLWIAFTPTEPDVCINISGVRYVSGSSSGVQSLIVSPSNPGTPCDNSWNVVNCPRNDIYGSEVGSVNSQNHCFTAVPGQMYYLIVDGNAGAVTEVYINGIEGLPVILAANLVDFSYRCNDEFGTLQWQTATEIDNDYFRIEFSENGEEWLEIGHVAGSGNKKSMTEYEFEVNQRGMEGYFRLYQVNYDGTGALLKTIATKSCSEEKGMRVIPNPSKGMLYLLDSKDYAEVAIVNTLGQTVFEQKTSMEVQTMQIDLTQVKKGIYLVSAITKTGEKQTQKIVIE